MGKECCMEMNGYVRRDRGGEDITKHNECSDVVMGNVAHDDLYDGNPKMKRYEEYDELELRSLINRLNDLLHRMK